MTPKKRCRVEIDLAHHRNRKVYPSGSIINGATVISANYDATIIALDIYFRGVATVALSSQYEFRTANHQFLLLKMPAVEKYLPVTKLLKAQVKHAIPFNFTVPYRLSINACKHKYSHMDVIEKHARLPPTLGSLAGDYNYPCTMRIRYSVEATLTWWDGTGTVQDRAFQAVIVLPELPEDPPLELSLVENRNESTKTKDIRENIFKSPVGSLTASMRQPHAITLSADGCEAVGSRAQVDFEFFPVRPEVLPPRVRVKSGKIQSTTFYAMTPFSDLPQSSETLRGHSGDTFSHRYTYNIVLLFPEAFNWMPGLIGKPQNLNSQNKTTTTSPMPDLTRGTAKHSTQQGGQPAKYTSSLHILFTLRSKKNTVLLPTFHSCFMSRIYALQLKFSVGASNSTIELAVPLQICVKTSYDPSGGQLPSFESVMAEDEQPGHRSLCTASGIEMRDGRAWSALPPEYEALGA